MSRAVADLLRRGDGDADPDTDPDTDPGRPVEPRVERRHARLARVRDAAGGGEVDGDARPARKGRGYRSMGRAMPLRFGVTLAAMLYSVLAPKLGVEPAVVMTVLGLAGAFMGFDALRPGGMVRE